MNVILFGLKRAFQSSIRVTRPFVARFGLTAARFDMLFALKKEYRGWYSSGVRQSDLRRMLGVTAPTVSRMLRSLEKLGLVTRFRPRAIDRRQRIVSLSRAGLACIRQAVKAIIRRGLVRRAFDAALTIGRSHVPGAAFLETANADSVCHCIREGFGDKATLYYPWGHPDD